MRPRRTAQQAKSSEVCRFHLTGSCMKGDSCYYSHDLSRVPCRYFHLWGTCMAGPTCRFSHGPIDPSALAKLRAEEAERNAAKPPGAREALPEVKGRPHARPLPVRDPRVRPLPAMPSYPTGPPLPPIPSMPHYPTAPPPLNTMGMMSRRPPRPPPPL